MSGDADKLRAALLREARQRFNREDRASVTHHGMLLAEFPPAEQLAVVRSYLMWALLLRSWAEVADAVVHLDAITEPTL